MGKNDLKTIMGLDEQKQNDVETYLTKAGFQLCIELVGKEKIEGKNCLLLKQGKVVDSYDETEDRNKLE